MPSRNNRHGRRPHAHNDDEAEFTKEGLQTLDGQPYRPPPQGTRPVLWAYPPVDFDYENQNNQGRPRRDIAGNAIGGNNTEAGPHRVIADRNKSIQGMVTHPSAAPLAPGAPGAPGAAAAPGAAQELWRVNEFIREEIN